MEMNSGMGVTPVYNLDGGHDRDGFFGDGGGMWMMMFLFFLLAWGGNGFGGFGNGGANALGVADAISNEFLYTNLNNTLGRIQDQNTFTSNSLQQGLCNLGYDNLSNFKDLQAEISSCCCNTNRNIDAVRYENAKNTCDIITNANYNTRDLIEAGNCNTQRIVDLITQDKIDSLRSELQSAQLQLSQLSQTEAIVSRVRPCPIPAYPTCNPWSCHGGVPATNCGLA